MKEVIHRLLWFAVAASAVAYATYLAAGSIVEAHASAAGAPVVIRDEIVPGVHHLFGMVEVSSPCEELTIHTEQVSATTYALRFETWREPSVTCSQEETPRAFHTTLFAPAAGVQFIASLDGAELPVVVQPMIGH